MPRIPRSFSQLVLAATLGIMTAAGHLHAQTSAVEPGLTLRIFDIGRPIENLFPLKRDQTPNVDRRIDQLNIRDKPSFGGPPNYFVVEAFGYLKVDAPGRYGFELTSDDGSRLEIRGETVIDHDGLHPANPKQGSAELKAGLTPFRVVMFDNDGQAALWLKWKPPGAKEFELVPASAFAIEKGVTRVVSPGKKVLLDGRENLRPGDGMPLESVHPGWTIENLRPQGFEPQIGGMDFLPDGRLVISTFKPANNGALRTATNGSVYILEGVVGGDPSTIKARKIADGFHDPCGVVVVDGDIYVSHRPGIDRLRDTDNDGTFKTHEVFATPWVGDNYHHFSFGLRHLDGWIYGALSTAIYFENTMKADGVKEEVVSMNGPNPPNRGTCYRVNIKTKEVEFIAGGFRTPNGIEVTKAGDIFVSDNQGAWLPANKLIHVKKGRFYGHYNGTQKSDKYPGGGSPALNSDKPPTPPTVWLPQNEVSNSPTTPMLIEDGPFKGQLWLAEFTAGGIRRIFLEEVNGDLQGAVFQFTQGFEVGVNRMVKGPDGCLYIGGTGAGGNWSWRGTQFGLQRLRPNGKTAFEYHSVSATPDGFNVKLTRAVDKAWLENTANYKVMQWRYVPTAEYGGPKVDEHRLGVARATAGSDGTSVRLVIPGLRPGNVVYLRMDPKSQPGPGQAEESMWATEAWYTLNAIPRGNAPASVGPAIKLLDRGDLANFAEPRGSWAFVGDAKIAAARPDRLEGATGKGAMLNGPDGNTSEIFTNFDHADVEVHIEFMVPKGSNSGVYFMGRYEVQILDSFGVASPQHSDCGGIYQRWDDSRGEGKEGYEGVPPRENASLPPGQWQTFDVIFRAPRFDDSGKKIANARFERVVHNGKVIHENIEVTGPTRAGLSGEKPFAPLRLQGDHGPVAFRNISLRPIPPGR